MVWQDIVMFSANLMFTFSLISQVYHGFKTKKGYIILKTSGITSSGLYVMSICFFTLSLYLSSIIAVINATLWATLFFQRLKYPNAK